VEGPDDYASMREVVHRRYARLKEEDGTMPNLIIADGGRGQMEAIRGEIEALGLNIPVAGLVKDHRHRTRELLFGNPPVSVGVQLDSYLFKVLTQMQDEVHRFAITFHRQQRSKRQTASALDNIPGIGEKTKQTLIQHFGSVKQILATTVEQFQEVLGEKRGAKLFEALHPTPTGEKEV